MRSIKYNKISYFMKKIIKDEEEIEKKPKKKVIVKKKIIKRYKTNDKEENNETTVMDTKIFKTNKKEEKKDNSIEISCNNEAEESYLNSLSELEKKTYLIAKNHLGTSYNTFKSIGYLKWKENEIQ